MALSWHPNGKRTDKKKDFALLIRLKKKDFQIGINLSYFHHNF